MYIFFRDYNPQQDIQAIARSHRIGQDKPVVALRLCVEYEAEFQISKITQRKTTLHSRVLDENKWLDNKKWRFSDSSEKVFCLIVHIILKSYTVKHNNFY